MASSFPIAQGSTLDFSFNWGPNTNGAAGPVGPGWLAPAETITSQTVTVSPAASGLTVSSVSQASGVVTFWAAATAAVGTFFTVTCSITTNNTPSRIDSRIMMIEVVAR